MGNVVHLVNVLRRASTALWRRQIRVRTVPISLVAPAIKKKEDNGDIKQRHRDERSKTADGQEEERREKRAFCYERSTTHGEGDFWVGGRP